MGFSYQWSVACLKIETHLLNHIVALALIAEIFFKMAQNIPIINLNPFACVIERLEKWTQITPRANISFSKDRQSIPPISLYGTHNSKILPYFFASSLGLLYTLKRATSSQLQKANLT